MNREDRRKAAVAGKRQKQKRTDNSPANEQIKLIFSLPCLIRWSDGSVSKSPIGQVFYTEEAYTRYKEYKRSGKPYPVRVEAIEPAEADKEKASSIFSEGTIADEWELMKTMCKNFSRALEQYVEEKDPLQLAEEASQVINAQAEEATNAMSANIPDLEGAEL